MAAAAERGTKQERSCGATLLRDGCAAAAPARGPSSGSDAHMPPPAAARSGSARPKHTSAGAPAADLSGRQSESRTTRTHCRFQEACARQVPTGREGFRGAAGCARAEQTPACPWLYTLRRAQRRVLRELLCCDGCPHGCALPLARANQLAKWHAASTSTGTKSHARGREPCLHSHVPGAGARDWSGRNCARSDCALPRRGARRCCRKTGERVPLGQDAVPGPARSPEPELGQWRGGRVGEGRVPWNRLQLDARPTSGCGTRSAAAGRSGVHAADGQARPASGCVVTGCPALS